MPWPPTSAGIGAPVADAIPGGALAAPEGPGPPVLPAGRMAGGLQGRADEAVAKAREKILDEADRAARAGWIDDPADIFFLRGDDLKADPASWRGRISGAWLGDPWRRPAR